jgi:hypothetical protein
MFVDPAPSSHINACPYGIKVEDRQFLTGSDDKHFMSDVATY